MHPDFPADAASRGVVSGHTAAATTVPSVEQCSAHTGEGASGALIPARGAWFGDHCYTPSTTASWPTGGSEQRRHLRTGKDPKPARGSRASDLFACPATNETKEYRKGQACHTQRAWERGAQVAVDRGRSPQHSCRKSAEVQLSGGKQGERNNIIISYYAEQPRRGSCSYWKFQSSGAESMCWETSGVQSLPPAQEHRLEEDPSKGPIQSPSLFPHNVQGRWGAERERATGPRSPRKIHG